MCWHCYSDDIGGGGTSPLSSFRETAQLVVGYAVSCLLLKQEIYSKFSNITLFFIVQMMYYFIIKTI